MKYFTKLIDQPIQPNHPVPVPKPKLFLCSRDIQVGDKLTHYKFINGDFIVKEVLENSVVTSFGSIYDKNDLYKVIGEISPDALSYVKEGQEFDENSIRIWDQGDLTVWIIVYIKGPCGHFH